MGRITERRDPESDEINEIVDKDPEFATELWSDDNSDSEPDDLSSRDSNEDD
jgi:hypothetical protein